MRHNVVPFELSRPHAQELIHKLAAAGSFVMEPVFTEKLHVRDFTMRQALTTMKEGTVNQGPTRDEYGDLKCRVRKRVAGRLVRVVVAIHEGSLLYLISIH